MFIGDYGYTPKIPLGLDLIARLIWFHGFGCRAKTLSCESCKVPFETTVHQRCFKYASIMLKTVRHA